jgi:hypothetical protein
MLDIYIHRYNEINMKVCTYIQTKKLDTSQTANLTCCFALQLHKPYCA